MVHQYNKDSGKYIKSFKDWKEGQDECGKISRGAKHRWSIQLFNIIPPRSEEIRCDCCNYIGFGSYMVEHHFKNCKASTPYKYNFVYKTTNDINKKTYIGVHSTNDMDDGYLGSGTLLKRSIKKYGSINFSREIIKLCESRGEAFDFEGKLVTDTYVQKPTNYNIALGGVGGGGIIYQKVYQFNLNGEYIRSYDSIFQAGKLSKIQRSSIGRCCKGLQDRAGLFLWSFYMVPQRPINPPDTRVFQFSLDGVFLKEFNSAKEASESTKVSVKKIFNARYKGLRGGDFRWSNNKDPLQPYRPHKKPVFQYSLDGLFIAEYETTYAAKTAIHISSTNITRCCRGVILSAGGFKWSYEKLKKPRIKCRHIFQFTKCGKFVKEYRSFERAAESTGLEILKIFKCCEGIRKGYNAYQWSYDRVAPNFAEVYSTKVVSQFSLNGEFIADYASVEIASQILGTPRVAISESCRGRHLHPDFIFTFDKNKLLNRPRFYQYNEDNEFLKSYRTITLGTLGSGDSKWSILANIKNKTKLTKNKFIWSKTPPLKSKPMEKYATNMRAVEQLTLHNNPIDTFPSIKAASLATGSSTSTISNLIQCREDSHNGFRWRYLDD